MTTSGTIGTTTVETRKVLEHAMRRVGISVAGQTPEIVGLALDNLFLLLLNMSSLGLNLWTIDKQILPTVAGQLKYIMPAGTIDVLNMSYGRCTYATGTTSSTTTAYTVALASATAIQRVGFELSVLPTVPLLIQGSNDGITWDTTTSIPVNELPLVNTLTYRDIDISLAAGYTSWRLYASGGVFTTTQLVLATQISELPITQMNRDDYSALPNKYIQGNPSVNFYYEKLVNPQVSLWPVPNSSVDQLVIWRYRQPQDVGSLSQTLEIPNRWFETIIWNLAARLCFELPQIDPAKVQAVLLENQKYQLVTENGETDGSPIYFAPNVSPYTR